MEQARTSIVKYHNRSITSEAEFTMEGVKTVKDRSAYFKKYCKEHAKERAETSRRWRKNNPEKEKALNARMYRKRKREGKE